MDETWPPRKIRAMIAMIAMRARISAYSARPWPSSSFLKDEIRALKNCILVLPPFLSNSLIGIPAQGPANLTSGRFGCQVSQLPYSGPPGAGVDSWNRAPVRATRTAGNQKTAGAEG